MDEWSCGQTASYRDVNAPPPPPPVHLPHIAPSRRSDSHQPAACTGPCLQVWPCHPLPGTALAPPHCVASIGFRQTISPQLHTGLGLRKWLKHGLRAGVYALCVSTVQDFYSLMLLKVVVVCCPRVTFVSTDQWSHEHLDLIWKWIQSEFTPCVTLQ